MARGLNDSYGKRTEDSPNRKARWEVVPTTATGSERVQYALTANRVPEHQQRETSKRYGTWDEAHARKRQLED